MSHQTKVWHKKLGEESAEKIKQYINYEELESKSDLKILDFGFGNGRYMYLFREMFPSAEIHGTEVDQEEVKNIKADFPLARTLSPYKAVLPYKDNYFGFIFSSNVIEHIPHNLYLEYIKEIHRVLAPGGQFMFATPNYPWKRLQDIKKALKWIKHRNKDKFVYYLFDDPTHVNKLNYKKLRNDMDMFKNVKLYPTQSFLYRLTGKEKFSDKIIGVAIK